VGSGQALKHTTWLLALYGIEQGAQGLCNDRFGFIRARVIPRRWLAMSGVFQNRNIIQASAADAMCPQAVSCIATPMSASPCQDELRWL
jgi:hypothetical protein